jgi:hypothetical protein
LLQFINAISDEIRSETINSTFDARKHGAFICFNAHFLSDATKVHTSIKDNCDLLIGWFYARGPLGIIYVRKSPEFRLRFFHFWPPFLLFPTVRRHNSSFQKSERSTAEVHSKIGMPYYEVPYDEVPIVSRHTELKITGGCEKIARGGSDILSRPPRGGPGVPW